MKHSALFSAPSAPLRETLLSVLLLLCLFAAIPSGAHASTTNLPSPSAIALMVDTNWAIVGPTNAAALAAAFRAANGIPGTNDTATLSNRVDTIEAWPTGNWSTAYGWGDHSVEGYGTGTVNEAYVIGQTNAVRAGLADWETDPVWLAATWAGTDSNAYRVILEALWNAADVAATSAVRVALADWETDPIWVAVSNAYTAWLETKWDDDDVAATNAVRVALPDWETDPVWYSASNAYAVKLAIRWLSDIHMIGIQETNFVRIALADWETDPVWLAASNTFATGLETKWDDDDVAATNAVRVALEGWEEANQGTYLGIEIPLGGAWDNYEIKGSTNNFTNYCYYFISYATNGYEVTGDATYTTADDTHAWVYFTDDFNPDPVGVLRWHKMTGNGNLTLYFANNLTECEKVVHCVSKDCDYPAARWQDPTNPNLVFSYIRVDGVDVEMNASDTLQHWSMIPPSSIKWSKSRPNL